MKAAALQTTNSDTELRQRARAATQVLADLESERTALADAEREIADLRSRRLARLVEASVDEVREIDDHALSIQSDSPQCGDGSFRWRPRS